MEQDSEHGSLAGIEGSEGSVERVRRASEQEELGMKVQGLGL